MPPEPFNVNDPVKIIRHAHGWEDGAMVGVVKERIRRPTGTFSYVVRIGGFGKNGYDCEVGHTRDMVTDNG